MAAAADVEGSGAFKDLGFRHAIDNVADVSKADLKELQRLSKLGHWLIDFPLFAQAFAHGLLSERHMRELYKLHNPKVHDQLVESQETLVEAARGCDFSDFVNVLPRRNSRTGKSFDVSRRQTRGELRSSGTATPTTNGNAMIQNAMSYEPVVKVSRNGCRAGRRCVGLRRTTCLLRSPSTEERCRTHRRVRGGCVQGAIRNG